MRMRMKRMTEDGRQRTDKASYIGRDEESLYPSSVVCPPSSDQVLLADGGAEPIVVRHELADELVQAALEQLVHAAVLEPGADLAREPLCSALAAVGARDVVEMTHKIFVA